MNRNELISYNDYYFDKYEYTQIGIGPNSLHVDQPANDIEKFFFKSTTCPFCGTILKEVFHGSQSDSIGTDLYMSGEVLECPTCSWWTYKTHFCDSCYSNGSYNAICTDTRHYAIAKKFNIDDKAIPLNVLKHELQNHKNLLYDINPYKLEDLCQDILKHYYDCDVLHVGISGDGGKDLIVLDSDEPILVQIKRRHNPNTVELLNGVREFVGTLFIENSRRGIYISTAQRFSKGSKNTIKKVLNERKLDYFEFIDYNKLCSLIDMTPLAAPKWKEFVKPFYENPRATCYDTEEEINKLHAHYKKLEEQYDI